MDPNEASPEAVLSPNSEFSSLVDKSRYGRTRRPKVAQDYFNIDEIVLDDASNPPQSPKPPLIVFDIKDEFTKLDDLGMKVANNFKANLQRGLDSTIKERKFFKSLSENKEVVTNGDVDKVLKIISTKPKTEFTENAQVKTPLKTYSNKRKHYDDCFIVESFGLPDKPIIPMKSPLKNKIEVDLKTPWRFEGFKPLYATEPQNKDGFLRCGILSEVSQLDTPKNCQENTNFEKSKIPILPSNETKEKVKLRSSLNNCEATDKKDTEITPNLEKIKQEIDVKDIKIETTIFEVGDLAWAKIGNYPFWPCLITQEPETGNHFKIVVRRVHPLYHVRFFGDSGRRSWVTSTHLMLYGNRDDLETIAKNVKPENKTKAAFFKEAYYIKSMYLTKWQIGVEEAESLKTKTVEERLNYFVENYDNLKKNKPKQEVEEVKKRKRESVDSNQSKKIKQELLEFDEVKSPARKLLKNKKESNSTPPVPKENPVSISPKKKYLKKEIFSEESLEARKKLRTSQIEKPIDDEKKPLKSKDESDDSQKRTKLEIANSDTDSKFSDNSVAPSFESQEALYKRNNIFRGVPREKVCQICEEGGDVFKCKGPCNGVYHSKCAQENNVKVVTIKSETNKTPPKLQTTPNLPNLSLAEKIDLRMKEIMKKVNHDEHNKSVGLKKEVPVIKHVTADHITYINLTDDSKEENDGKDLKKCLWCSKDEKPKCLVCNKDEAKSGSKFRQKCSLHQCGRYYHPECLKVWPQTQWSLTQSMKDKDVNYDTFVCPRHFCHTCIADELQTANTRLPSDKIVKCLRCPATYHSSSSCVPAGTHILTNSQIICPRHYKITTRRNMSQTINANWCFLCSKGGNLICCETCPTSVHIECLPGDFNKDETFYCEDCQSGRLPLYDEIVWVKLGAFRWWPALILFPNEIPDNVKNIVHCRGEFVVKFYGTYDHYWVSRGRTFLFQEGDKGHSSYARKKVDTAFVKAIGEAETAHQLKRQFKLSKLAEKNTDLKPPPYIRIKVNKPVGNVRLFEGNTSNTTSCDCDPNESHPCGPDSDCLNRLLLTECNPEVCPAGHRCNNQRFEKREYPPLVPHRTQLRGWGLKTLAPIRKGQFVIEYVGEIIDEQEYQRRIQKMHEQKEENYYFLTIDKDRTLDAGPKGNVARFMNHSCQPNCETQKWTVNGHTRVGLFANCDIPADTELTFNYNLECIGKEKKICKCGAPNCSGFIGVKVKSDVPPKKVRKIKKKKELPPPVQTNDNPCFVCGKCGDVGACNNKMCTKFYHLSCVNLTNWPDGNKWICQWHNCNICTKRTIRCCIKCLNSYCPSHSEGNVRYDKLLGFVCSEHDPSKILPNESDFESIKLNGLTSTPLKNSSQDENLTKKKKRKDLKQTANLFNSLSEMNKTTPVKYLRTSRNSNKDNSDKVQPIKKRNRL